MDFYFSSYSSYWQRAFLALLGATLLIMLILSVVRFDFVSIFLTLSTLALMFLPDFIRAKYDIYIPKIFALAMALFAYATVFLGELNDFYYRIWWWDMALHSVSAVGFGLLGFIILLILFERHRVTASPAVLSVFSFSFALGIGVLWEIFEFTMDTAFGFNMQKSGLRDTMTDLIVDALGAAIAACIGYRYLRFRSEHKPKNEKEDSPLLARSIHEAVVKNLE